MYVLKRNKNEENRFHCRKLFAHKIDIAKTSKKQQDVLLEVIKDNRLETSADI